MSQSTFSMSSQRCCILCGARISNINLNSRDIKYRCPSCGIMFHRQQCGRRSESIRVYYGDNIT